MEINVWFYAFSTAAQVSAAIVGLFAVFAVYKIQEFSNDASEARDRVKEMLPFVSGNAKGFNSFSASYIRTLTDIRLLEIFRELLDLKRADSASVTVSHPSFNEHFYDSYSEVIDLKIRILNDLKEILVIGFGVIGIALAAIVFTEWITSLKWLGYLVLALYLGLFIFFLYAMYRGIYETATRGIK